MGTLPYNTERLIFNNTFYSGIISSMQYSESIECNTAYNRGIIVNVYPDKEFFVPCIALCDIAEACIVNEKNDFSAIIPFYTSARGLKKTASSILNNMISIANRLLAKVHTDSTVYYGNGGIILNKDFNPLFLSGYNVIIDKGDFILTSPVVYLNPSVFTDTDIISKAIVKKLLPLFSGCSSSFRHYQDGYRIKSYYNPLIKIIVEDISHMIYTVSKPKNLNFSEECINLLRQHKNELI